jgi:antitoxin CptB
VEGKPENARLLHRFGNRQQVAQKFRDPRADTVDDADGRKQGIEDIRAHAAIFNPGEGAIKADKRQSRRYIASILLDRKDAAMIPSGPEIATDLDARRRRAKFRAWHRGMKEMDLLLGKFADAHTEHMTADDLVVFEELLEILDRDLFKWFTGEGPVPASHDTPLFRAICEFHGIDLP